MSTQTSDYISSLRRALHSLRAQATGGDIAQVFHIQRGIRLTTITMMPADPYRPSRLIFETGCVVDGAYLTFHRDVAFVGSERYTTSGIREILRHHFLLPTERST